MRGWAEARSEAEGAGGGGRRRGQEAEEGRRGLGFCCSRALAKGVPSPGRLYPTRPSSPPPSPNPLTLLPVLTPPPRPLLSPPPAAAQIYVEIERARITRQLARMREEEGKVAEAAEILQEVPVETFGAMAKTERIAYILEQVGVY